MRYSLRSLNSASVRDGLAVAALLLLVLLFLGRGLLPGKVLLPLDLVTQAWPPWQRPNQPVQVRNYLLGDAVNYIFPIKQFAADSVRQGVIPLWNPYSLGGYPFIYNTQAGLFYPLSVAYYLLPPATAVNVVIALQMFLGALFMYVYLRQVVARRLAALAGAVLFSLNGLMVIWLEWQVIYAAVIWLPLQLYLVERMARRVLATGNEPMAGPSFAAGRLEAILAGVAVAFSWLGGHWNWTLYASMTLGAYLLWRLWPPFRQAQSERFRRQIAFLCGLPLATGLALSLVQVWPAASYLIQSHRQPLEFAASLDQGLLNRLVVLLIPNFFGSPTHQNWWGPLPTNYAETTFYVGILPLLLGGIAPLLRRDRLGLFFAGWGALGLLWALGTPAYGLLYALPVFNGLLPSRAALLVVFCLAVLAAISIDRLMEAQLSRRQRLARATSGLLGLLILVALAYSLYYRPDVARTWSYLRSYTGLFVLSLAVSGGLLLGRLHGWIPAPVFGWLALGWLTADLLAFGYGYNPVSSVADLYPPTATAAFLRGDPELFRMTTIAEGIAFPPNTSLVPRLTSLSGYEPGILRRAVEFMSVAEGENAVRGERELVPLRGLNSPLIALLNVKYIVTTADWFEPTSVTGFVSAGVTEWRAMVPGAVLGQPFTMPDAGLHRLDLSLRPAGEPSGTVTVRIFTADGRQELAHDSLDVAEVRQAGWYSFLFDAFPSEWGRSFYLAAEYDGPDGELAIGISNGGAASPQLAVTTYYLPRPHLAHEDGKTRVYLNDGYFPRAFAVPQAVVAADAEEALAAVLAHQDQLDKIVVLELEGQPPPPDLGPGGTLAAAVTITNYELNRVTVTAAMPSPGFVVLGDTYYPGWRARIDGQSTPVYRADYLLRAVYVPAGLHTIVFSFWPLDFILGGLVSGIGWVACSVAVILSWRRRLPGRRRPSRGDGHGGQ